MRQCTTIVKKFVPCEAKQWEDSISTACITPSALRIQCFWIPVQQTTAFMLINLFKQYLPLSVAVHCSESAIRLSDLYIPVKDIHTYYTEQ